MSINSAMSAGVTGLVANSSALAAISDNIANVNTVGYKRNSVNFSSIVTSQAVPGRYSAGGVTAVTHQLVSQQGTVQSAASPTDIAISGDGFFVVTSKAQGLSQTDPRLFTRAGSFTVDASGYMVNDAGLYLQGWPVNAAGNYTVDPSDLTAMQPINVKSLGASVAATTAIGVNANLNKDTTVSPAELTYAAASQSMANYASTGSTVTGTQPDFTMQMNVVDSAGGSHKLAVSFLKSSAAANEWHAEIYAVPASDVNAGADGLLADGDVTFNLDGTIDLANTTLFGAAGATPQLVLGASTGAAPQWDPSLGIDAQTIALDFTKISQISGTSTLKSVSSDGARSGNVISVQVDADGSVSAVFDNSQVRKIAVVGLATFPNPNGLKAVNGNAYQASRDAGTMVAKPPTEGGAGKIAASSLEASTVDLSSEFTGLITTQKAYSASSKIITTADQMLDELIQMKR